MTQTPNRECLFKRIEENGFRGGKPSKASEES